MDEENLKYKIPLSQFSQPNKFHFSSYIKDNFINKKTNFNGLFSSPEKEQEYQKMFEQKKIIKEKSIINLTSIDLKKDYTKKYNEYNSGLKNICFISIFSIISTFIEIKYLGPSESNIAILIMCCISITFSIILIISLKENAIIDSYAYVAFYLFSMIESLIFICLFIFKISNFILINQSLSSNGCISKYKCTSYFIYLLILMINVIAFVGFIIIIKFSFALFLDGFNILILKKKTLFQRQIERDEKNLKGEIIEFTDDNDEINNNSSLGQLNTKDILKGE